MPKDVSLMEAALETKRKQYHNLADRYFREISNQKAKEYSVTQQKDLLAQVRVL